MAGKGYITKAGIKVLPSRKWKGGAPPPAAKAGAPQYTYQRFDHTKLVNDFLRTRQKAKTAPIRVRDEAKFVAANTELELARAIRGVQGHSSTLRQYGYPRYYDRYGIVRWDHGASPRVLAAGGAGKVHSFRVAGGRVSTRVYTPGTYSRARVNRLLGKPPA